MELRRNVGPWGASYLGLVLVLVFGLGGCKPKPGGSCSKEGREVCQDKGSALLCRDGKWDVMPCRGGGGCVGAGDSAQCDNTYAEENDPCALENDHACSVDKKSFLQCTKKKWVSVGPCRGPNGCQAGAKSIKCDATIVKTDDPCLKDDEGDHACAEDRKTVLVCKAGHFVFSGKCGGPKGCRVKGDDVECDDSVSDVGDPCDLADNYSCSRDGRFLLVCRNGRFQKDEECKRKTCRVQGDKAGCM